MNQIGVRSSLDVKGTFAVLKASILQSGRMLIETGGNSYEEFSKITVALLLLSVFTRRAAHSSDFPLKT